LVLCRKILFFTIFLLLLSNKPFAQDAVDIAINQIGDDYEWGGNGPDAFDCSGLTRYAYGQVGVELPRTSGEQSQTGELVTGEFQRGDLLFFATDDDRPGVVTHVGIYEADDIMINAQWYDTGIVRADISSNYWSSRLLFARRIISEPDTITFLSRNEFDSAFPNALVEDWDTFTAGTTFPNGTTVNGITYNSSSGIAIVTDFFLQTTLPNSLGRTPDEFFAEDDTITFTFDMPISAFGIDINTFDSQDSGYVALTDRGDVFNSIFEPFPGQNTGQFLGFSTETSFNSVTISAPGGFSYTVDTMRHQ
jgi:hypothetical protein